MPSCCNNFFVGWLCPRCSLPVSFVEHGGSEPVPIGQIATKNVTVNQQLIQGDFIAAGGTKIGTNLGTAVSGNVTIGALGEQAPPPAEALPLPPPPVDLELPPPPDDLDSSLPPPPQMSSDPIGPDPAVSGKIGDDGYEWLEHPGGSNQWFHRQPGIGDWTPFSKTETNDIDLDL